MTIPAYQERVIQEKQDLDEKIDKLSSFISSEFGISLPIADRHRLFNQHKVMLEYSAILGERIEAFNSTESFGASQ